MVHTAKTLQEAFKYLFPDEVTELQRLTNTLPDNPVVVNIGAGAGTSGLTFMEARPDLFLYTIDITKEPSPFGCLSGEELVLTDAGYWQQGRNKQIHGDSKETGKHWGGGKVDKVFVDGEHSYMGCRGDLLAWVPHIKDGGIISIHDYKKEELYAKGNLPEHRPAPAPWKGVDTAVDIVLKDLFNLEVISVVESLINFRVDAKKLANFNSTRGNFIKYLDKKLNAKMIDFFNFTLVGNVLTNSVLKIQIDVSDSYIIENVVYNGAYSTEAMAILDRCVSG